MFYMCEKLCYATVFISWLVIKVEKGSYATTLGASVIVVGVFVVVFINEIILQKVSSIDLRLQTRFITMEYVYLESMFITIT